MIERVIFTPDADDDVAGSYDWYESQEPGLGEDFLRSVEACVRGIQRSFASNVRNHCWSGSVQGAVATWSVISMRYF